MVSKSLADIQAQLNDPDFSLSVSSGSVAAAVAFGFRRSI